MLVFPCQIESYRSLKDKTTKVVLETNELTPEQILGLAGSLQKFGYIAFKEETFKNNEKEVLENLKADYEEKGKTPSQRLRGVLFVNYDQDNEGYQTFSDYYNAKMEKIVTHYKNKLD